MCASRLRRSAHDDVHRWLVIREVEGEKESVGECGLVDVAGSQHQLVIVYHMGGEERMRRGFAG